ncbi:D-glycero-beta-D-manno-heptose 1-phosphate adenylyltransferase [Chitinophaga horti]|uniref:Bifunctional protein HldE n=1 Tax=Chitinophaga horti TaxID=2920382 RepID=A0ABY6J372_9BACT|nr:D-glycero-beta-D-manno-heptose 1-phosphate adenylyltransferase [Chitinophaga horti]UYQ94092.1 D-glycero-beta-D-manno-heptose 1-phosphate adenylyltransferase [Chitinophaga horti]
MNSSVYQIIDNFRAQRILVIGDLMLDVYLKGSSSRLSPEAPVPVVNIHDTTIVPGGAANTAANLSYLGAQVTCCCIVGNDADGCTARTLLTDKKVQCSFVIDGERQTIVKTRVMAGRQLITRYDKGQEDIPSEDTQQRLIALLPQLMEQADAVIIADYEKGVLSPAVINAIAAANVRLKRFIAVDARQPEKYKVLQPDLLKPNYYEATKLLGLPATNTRRAAQVMEHGKTLYARTRARITALTLDEEGAVIFDRHKPVYQSVPRPVNNPQVSGAGDVYISAFSLSVLSGGSHAEAAEIAAMAAMVAIEKCDTAHCLQQELIAAFLCGDKHLTTTKDLQHLCDMYRQQGRRIVFTNGCFDILHSGHVSYLNQASELGDVLIVGINNDESIARLKGPTRPINRLADRIAVLAALAGVTHIISFGDAADDTPKHLIEIIKPAVFVKGGDYTQEQLPEAPLVKELGGKVVILPLVPGRSTTRIISRIHKKPVLKLA